MLIGLQSGHKNITSNIDPVLAGETGATGEMDFNWNVTLALSTILQKYGFQVQIDDANANSNTNTLGKDFAFYLAIHAEGAPTGGNVVAPDPSVDAVNSESRRIVDCINNEYFKDTGIVNNGLVTNNETFYYMWNVLTAKTPCGIIECGDLADAHDSVILADHNRVALGIAHGLCEAFNITWKGDPMTWEQPTDPCADYKKQITTLQSDFDNYKASHPDSTVTTQLPISEQPAVTTASSGDSTETPSNQDNSDQTESKIDGSSPNSANPAPGNSWISVFINWLFGKS